MDIFENFKEKSKAEETLSRIQKSKLEDVDTLKEYLIKSLKGFINYEPTRPRWERDEDIRFDSQSDRFFVVTFSIREDALEISGFRPTLPTDGKEETSGERFYHRYVETKEQLQFEISVINFINKKLSAT